MPDKNESAEKLWKEEAQHCIPYLSIDCVIFGFHLQELKVLLVRWKSTEEWSLPGGFIRKVESVDAAAERILQERTGLEQIFLQQFHVFGKAQRYNQQETWARINLPIDLNDWSERTISLGYYALVEHSVVKPAPDYLSDACSWWSLEELPDLLFDHNHIIEVALQSLHRHLPYQPISHLLPPKFSLPELQRLYETILGTSLDSRNFYKKVMTSGILQRLDERRRGNPYRSPYLYQFDPETYADVLRKGSLSFT